MYIYLDLQKNTETDKTLLCVNIINDIIIISQCKPFKGLEEAIRRKRYFLTSFHSWLCEEF